MKVYHIVKNSSKYFIGDSILPKTYCLCDFSIKKRQVEAELEKVRKDCFPDFPSRLHCLFVCNDMDDVEFWAIQKSNTSGQIFKILTLEIEEPVFWFSAESYNMYFNGLRNDIHQACIDFWESNIEIDFDNLKDREGLTNGSAQIVAIQQASVTRENGLEYMNSDKQ